MNGLNRQIIEGQAERRHSKLRNARIGRKSNACPLYCCSFSVKVLLHFDGE
jgi:hypothetical protein